MNKLVAGLMAAYSVRGQDDTDTDPSPSCLYCKRMDTNAGFLVSYSYCKNNKECLMDAWNYLDRPCKDDALNIPWTAGNQLDYNDDCFAEEMQCPSYESTPDKHGVY